MAFKILLNHLNLVILKVSFRLKRCGHLWCKGIPLSKELVRQSL